MDTVTAIDACFARLHAAGWSVGDLRIFTPVGAVYGRVDGVNGENKVEACAPTQAAAWALACDQARTLGMLR
jgi:hypothetical protein